MNVLLAGSPLSWVYSAVQGLGAGGRGWLQSVYKWCICYSQIAAPFTVRLGYANICSSSSAIRSTLTIYVYIQTQCLS